MKRLLLLLCALLIAPTVLAANPQVELKTTLGNVIIELYPENAPKTVENFLQYVKDGYYDGTIFHRVIPGFMAQGGGFSRNFQQKPTRPAIRNEAGNGLRNAIGTVAMARTADPHSATAQFFINVAENDFLDFKSPDDKGYGYTVFGRVTSGMDVVQKMLQVPTSTVGPHQNVPRQPIVIEQARLIDKAAAKPAKAK
jgi:peptidyl-prolyl cis-trans isomerase A (cyclophilin A)/peptidyl-prolyl cis-trans isomerase B (cyclophilin B)